MNCEKIETLAEWETAMRELTRRGRELAGAPMADDDEDEDDGDHEFRGPPKAAKATAPKAKKPAPPFVKRAPTEKPDAADEEDDYDA